MNKEKVISSMMAVLAIVTMVMTAIYHAQKVQIREQLIATNPELARAMTYGELTEEDEKTQSENVRFSVYFARDLNGDGYADRVKGTCKEVEGEDTLYMSLNVLGDGYLKDAKIEIEADNIYFKTALVDDDVISGNYISENTTAINLKQINAGTQKLIFGQVRTGDYRYTSTKRDAIGKDTNKYSGINKIKLTGTHVKNDGTETKIEKEIEVPVDWYGTTKAEIPYTYGSNGEKNKYQNYNTEGIVDEENQEVNLEFKIVSQESNNKLLLEKSTIEGTIPELNGYKATKVEVIGDNVEYTYDEETGNFTAYREATIGEDGVVTKEAYSSNWNTARYNEIKLKVTYPLEAYEQSNGSVILNIPVKATFEGYNNKNEEFDNPYVSNIAEDIITVTYERGGGDVITYDVQVGTWVPNPYNVYVVSKENAVKYYNQVQEDTKDTYEVRWYVSRGNSGEISNVELREQDSNYTDKFLTTDGTYEDMLKYSKNIGIYFTTPGAMFGENGWIRVYNDETDELIHEFTSEDWEIYTKENPYYYNTPIDHIRIETSKAERVSSFTATSIKEMDNETLTTDKTREEFDKLSKIYSYLSGYAKYSEEEEYQKLKDDVGIANYDETLSMAQITNVTPTTLSTQETTNMKITIGTVNLGYNVESWKNGIFLLKFTEEVLLAEINSVNINNGNVSILGYDIYEQDGSYFLKILTENENPEHYTITVDANITPDPRKISATRDIELYAYNEECNNYKDNLRAQDIYDINGDGNTEDLVDYSKRTITFVGPTTLLTTETASDYNEEGDELKTTVAPQVAEIDKTQNNRTAKISIQITNNYSGNISGIVVVGKTPFAGNTSQILGTDLGSTFTAKMTGPIELPEKLQGIATVYYSENETVNNDLNDASNNWKTAEQITDFSKIRTYAIDLRDYTIEKSEEYICTYEIEVPQSVNYNDVSFSTHAVYFYLETDEGKLADQTETNKLGFKIARKYNLEINKVKQGTNSPIQGASFSVQEEGEESSRIVSSDAQGKINIQDLYVGKVYTVKELKAPNDYVLNGETIKFTTTVDDNGDLQVEKLEGNSNLNVEQATEEEPAKVSFTVTNEPKYTLKLTKEDQDGNLVQGVRFNLTGTGLPAAGRTVTTNSKGELTITGLYPNEEYTLTEIYAEGYAYSEAPIKFKTVWNGNNLEAQVIEGSFKEQPTVDNTQEKQPIMSASIVNTKLDEYNLVLGKYEKETPNPLEGAVFRITGKWLDNEYTTDESGELQVGPLYEGIEYTIEEIMPPTGYALSDNIVKFVANKDEEGNSYLQILEGEIKPAADFENEEGSSTYGLGENKVIDNDGNEITDRYVYYRGKIVTLALDNEPLFSLTKIDGETQEPLPNVKFAITKVEDDGTETQAVNSKGEVIGETVQIDDKTYQVITTDEQGRITEDLPEGYYKVVEIEMQEGYQLPENEEDRTYFFGIGKTKPAVKEMVELWSQSLEGNGEITYTDSVATDDGGYIKIGYFKNSVKFNADETENGEEIVLTAQGSYEDGVILKYNSDNKIEWSNSYGDKYKELFYSIVKSMNGNYVVTGTYNLTGKTYTYHTFHLIYNNLGELIEEKTNLQETNNGNGENKIVTNKKGEFFATESLWTNKTVRAENTVDNKDINIEVIGKTDGLLIKYTSEHKVEWIKQIGNEWDDYINDLKATEDGGVIIVGSFFGDIIIPKEETENDEDILLENSGSNSNEFIIKYNSEGKVCWGKSFGNTLSNDSSTSIIKTANNKYIVTLQMGNSIGYNIPKEETVNGEELTINRNNGLLELNDEGLVEWATSYPLGNPGYFSEAIPTEDNGYLLVGKFNAEQTIPANETVANQEIQLTSNGSRDYLVLKFNKDNKVEWAGQFGSIAEEADANIKSVIELPNNRYLVQVYLTAKATISSDQTTLGEDVELLGNATLIYNSDGLVEYASSEVSSSSQYNSAVETSNGGQIAVGQMTGKLSINAEQTSTGENIELLSNGNTDMLLAKYNQDGKIDWGINLGGTGADLLNDVIKKDDTYIVVGNINGNLHIDKEYTYNGEDIDITSRGDKGIIIEFNEEGKVITVKVAEGGKSKFSKIQNLETGGYIVGAKSDGNSCIIDDIQIDFSSSSTIFLIEFNSDNSVKNLINTYINSLKEIVNIVSLDDGGIVVVGDHYWSYEFTIPSEATTIGEITVPASNNVDGLIARFNADRKLEYIGTISDKAAQSIKDVIETKDGGYLAFWSGYIVDGIEFTEKETASGESIKESGGGPHPTILIKYNSDNKVEWVQNVDDARSYGLRLLSTKDNEYIVTTENAIFKYSSSFEQQYTINPNGVYLDIVDNGDNTYTFFGYQTENSINTAKVAKFQENTILPEIPEQQEIIVENYKKEYKITTEVEGEGGSISGQGSTEENPYEIVKHGEDSTKDIVVTPEEGYKILKITVNGEEINFVPEEDGSVILDKFVNMTSDKHVVVQFSNTVSTVIVHHYKDGTTDKLAEDETLTGEIGTNYTTSPKDIADYEVVIEKLPSNASGQYTADVKEVIYYYKQTPVKFIVHHYLEGTEEIVPGSEDDQINEERERGSEYTTSPATGIDEKYELVEVLGNPSGTLTGNETVITYYYRVKDSAGVIVHHIDTESKEQIAPDVMIPSTGTGKYGDSYTTTVSSEIPANYEYVTRTDNWEGTMVDTLTEVTYEYRLVDPSITNQDISKTATASIDNPKAQIEYGINYTTTIENYIGRAQVTIVDTLPYKIDVAKSSLNGGTYDEESQTITWTELVDGIDTYTNPESGNIEIHKTIKVVYLNMDVSKETIENNVSGNVKLLTPSKTSEEVTDIATTNTEFKTNITVNKVWEDNDIQSARRPEVITINVIGEDDRVIQSYDLKVKEGETSHTFTDLPKYNREGNEIPYTVEEKEKTLGDLKFYEAEENPVLVEDNQATIRNTFVKPDDTTTVTVNKVWNDNNNVNGKRPESIVVKVAGNGQTYTQEINAIDNETEGNVNEWTYTFTNLPKYDDNGQEIVYTASEEEADTDDLKFYTNDGITGDMTSGYTITNTFTVPDERIELTVNKVWEDNSTQAQRRPETIVINVKAENADNNDPEAIIDTYELDTETETSHTFTDLPKYNSQGNEIQYTVEEQEKNPGDLHFYTISVGTVESTDENTKEVTITNTFEKPDDTTEVTVTKVWDDNNDEAEKRPESINLQLKNGNATVKEQEVNVSNAVSGDTNTWQYTFTDVEKYNDNGQEIVYTVDETEVNNNDLQFYTKKLEGTTVTNTFTQNTEKVEIQVKKIWEDNEIQAQRRPESIIIVLKANGVENQRYELTKENADTSDENTWTYTFTELPKYDQYNNIINYTIEEEEKTQGDLKFYTSKIDETTITNTFTRPTETISIDVNKNWEDQENVYNKRPTSIRLEVKQGENVVKSAVVTQDDNWQTIFTDLPKYDDNGQEIEYTVDEEEVSPNDLFYYEKHIGEVTDKDMVLDEKEATITNTMTKIPSTVVVKYVDKNTGEEISDSKTKEGIIGDTFDVTEDKKDIEGYTLVEEPAEKEGVYTEEPQEKIYYYAKNTRVIVKYLEQDDTPEDIADNQVLADEVTIDGYEGKEYTTVEEEIHEYTLVATTDNLEGTMERDEIVVIYYYAPNTNVIVKYLEQDDTPNDNSDNKVLAPEVTIDGYVGKDYTTVEEEIPGYTLVATTDNLEGTMTKDPIEVIYYYAQNTKVIVKYLEKDDTPDDNTDNQVLANEVTIDGYEGLEYETEQKDIENYTFVESTNNTEGTMTNDVIEVIYYYAQNTKATVQHIDRETGEILYEERQEGKVGDLFETHPEDFEGYVLVEVPEEPDIIMDKTGEQVVKYYYAHVSAGVIEKHIDDITGELLYSEEHQGNEGDQYNIPSKTFDGYDLVTEDEYGNSRLPENSEGEMKRDEVIEVKYYYIKKAKVIVKYLEEDDTPEDTTDNQVLAEEEIIEGHENDNYETEAKEIEGYDLVEIPDNAIGTMVITKNPDGTYNTEIEVIYYYKKVAGGVIENHIDITTNEILASEEHKGNVGDAYDIPSREFEGYDLVIEDENGNSMLPTNAKGEMTEEQTVVNYYYIKQAKVKVEYIDKLTGEKLDEEEIQGHVGDEYTTEEKEFDGYELVEKPSNSTGEMTEEETVVKYYYIRKAEVEVKYLEKETEYEIAEREILEGYVGDSYETEQKDIPYYKFVESTDNTNGTMEKDKITVIYYYEKQVFNLGIDKWVSSVNVNGISQGAKTINNKDEMYVVDIHRSKTDTADIKITYKIRVTNKGEIEGTAGEIIEIIPAGYSYYQEDNNIHWEERDGTLVTNALAKETIEPGEYKELEIVLRWNRGENNFGKQKNRVILSGETNPAGYADINKEDNQSSSNMMITVATGLDRNGRFILNVALQILIVLAVGLILIRRIRK